MNNKILIGSIIAVVILILVSFTSAVGFHSVKSTSAIDSPLFGIRTRRAIGQGQQDITTDYLGHGEETNLHLSNRIKRAEQVQKAIDIISKMDDKTFNKFVSLIFSRIKQNSIDDEEIVIVLNQVKNNQEINETAVPLPIWNDPYTIGAWFPGCWIINIFITIVNSIQAYYTY